MKKLLALSAGLGLWMWRKQTQTTRSQVAPPGGQKQMETRMLEAGAALLQSKSPLSAMNLYLDGFHFFADDMKRQMEAHHYCTQVNEDVIQCVIFDGNKKDARLIGVEYILSERLFKTLPDDERKLWHSHHYEVKSGTLVAAGIPENIERQLMHKVISTYGKTWHTWDTHKDPLPRGIPSLMMGFTEDGQMQPELVRERDRRFGISTAERRRLRSHIPMPELVPGANWWQGGRTVQIGLEEKDFKKD